MESEVAVDTEVEVGLKLKCELTPFVRHIDGRNDRSVDSVCTG